VKKFEKKNLNSNILYINLLSQLKLRMLADFERLPIMKLNEYDKANIQFLINNNSCELKVHSKNKCFNVSTSLQYTYLYVLEILYLNIKILTGRIS
jgi:hypothetical protein